MIAIFTGTNGVVVVGAFTNFVTIITTFSNGAINNGVVKYTAEYRDDQDKFQSLFITALKISIICSLFFGSILILFAKSVSVLLFSAVLYVDVIRIFGLTIIFYSINSLLISILNGKGEIKLYTLLNALGSLIGLLLTIGLVFYFKIKGALYSLVLAQSIVFFVTILFITKMNWFRLSGLKKIFDLDILRKLSHYSLMAIISALTVPMSQILLRNIMVEKVGIDSAGQWQGLMRVSDGYLYLITTALNTYYLPKLSILIKRKEIKDEVLNAYKIIMPAVMVGCITIYFSRFLIIELLYTPKFFKMEELFFYQLVGDFFKIATWILGFIFLAKSMTKAFIIIEITFSLTYVIIGYILVSSIGAVGITMAFAINYFLCLLAMVVIFRKLLFSNH